jgi:hypothetical protein
LVILIIKKFSLLFIDFKMRASAVIFIPGAKGHPTTPPTPSVPDENSLKVLKVYRCAINLLLLRLLWCGAYGVCLEEKECYCGSIDEDEDDYCLCGDCKVDHSQHFNVKEFCSDFCEGVCRLGSNCPESHPSLDEIKDRISLLASFHSSQTEEFFENEYGFTGLTELPKDLEFPTLPQDI